MKKVIDEIKCLEQENELLKEKLDIAINRFLVIKNQIELWKIGVFAKTEYCVEYYIEKTVDETLDMLKNTKNFNTSKE